MDDRIFNACMRLFLCVRVLYTQGLGTPTASQHNTFDSEELSQIALVSASGLEISSPTLYQWSHPVTPKSVKVFVWLSTSQTCNKSGLQLIKSSPVDQIIHLPFFIKLFEWCLSFSFSEWNWPKINIHINLLLQTKQNNLKSESEDSKSNVRRSRDSFY